MSIVQQPSWRNAIVVAILCLIHGLVVILVTAIILISRPQHLDKWAAALGISAAILGAIQYLPQIWTTYWKQDVGSLSIPMMLIQTPGSFLWAASLAARLGARGWSSWGLFLVTGTLQGCLLVMGIIFEIRKKENGTVENDEVCNFSMHIIRQADFRQTSSLRQMDIISLEITSKPTMKEALTWRMNHRKEHHYSTASRSLPGRDHLTRWIFKCITILQLINLCPICNINS